MQRDPAIMPPQGQLPNREPEIAQILSFLDFGPEASSRIVLANGDVVLVSISQGVVSISKRRWRGMMPSQILWQTHDVAHSLQLFAIALEAGDTVLGYLNDLVAQCASAADVRETFLRIERGEQARSKAWH